VNQKNEKNEERIRISYHQTRQRENDESFDQKQLAK
jgi:hypothetical protein